MSFALEFPDSEVRDVVADGAAVRLRFAAAAGRNDAGERGWLTGLQLDLGAASWHGDPSSAFGKIAQAALRHGGHRLPTLTVPATLAGAIELELRMASGTQLVLRATSLDASVADHARFTEDLSC